MISVCCYNVLIVFLFLRAAPGGNNSKGTQGTGGSKRSQITLDKEKHPSSVFQQMVKNAENNGELLSDQDSSVGDNTRKSSAKNSSNANGNRFAPETYNPSGGQQKGVRGTTTGTGGQNAAPPKNGQYSRLLGISDSDEVPAAGGQGGQRQNKTQGWFQYPQGNEGGPATLNQNPNLVMDHMYSADPFPDTRGYEEQVCTISVLLGIT